MGILDSAKNILSGEKWGAKTNVASDNRVDRIDQCKVVWYQWANDLTGNIETDGPQSIPLPPSILSDSRSWDISNHIEAVSYSKSMGDGAGSFSITLQNTFDWPRFMRPGQWLCIYLCNDGGLSLPKEPGQGGTNAKIGSSPGNNFVSLATRVFSATPTLPLPEGPDKETTQRIKPYLRCMGIIQRVAIKSHTSVDGTVETSFTITGKDFGAVFEETELWFNASDAEAKAFEAVVNSISTQFVKNLTELLYKWYDIFLSPATTLATAATNIKSFFPTQWVMPNRLVSDLDLKMNLEGRGTFGDIADVREFHPTIFEHPEPLPFAGLQGRCWDKMKEFSQQGFHELFSELSDSGNPKLIFRPVPWARDTSNYPEIGKTVLKYKDLVSSDSLLILDPGVSNFGSLKDLTGALSSSLGGAVLPDDVRVDHRVPIKSTIVESYDIGPDYHARANFFLVDAMQHAFGQQNAWALLSKDLLTQWPLRDEPDIMRHGFRPKYIYINTFNLTSERLFGAEASLKFIKEVNFMLKDFWADAEDFYSGSMTLATGLNTVKLGKVLITDSTFQGIKDMCFYIEGYNDSFSVNGDGVCSWTQTLNLTRGMQLSVLLENASTKDVQQTEPKSFHIQKNEEDEKTLLKTIKNGITDPKSLF